LKKLDVAFVEANDDIQRGLMGREAMYSALLKAASELQKVLAQAAEYEQLAKSGEVRKAARGTTPGARGHLLSTPEHLQ